MSDREMSPLSLPSCMYSSEPASSNSSDCPNTVKQMNMMHNLKDEHLTPKYESNGINEACVYEHRSPPNYMEAVYQNGSCVFPSQPNIPVFLNPAYTNRTQNVNGVVKRKRIRTAFTTNQLQDLEDQYRTNRYLERGTRIFLSRKLNVSERVIKIWFQNRRMKEKKDRAECQIVDSCTLPASSSSRQDSYEPPFPVYNIHTQPVNNNGLMNCDSFIYEETEAVNIGLAPMMAEPLVLLPRSSEPPAAAEVVHFNRYPQNMPPPYESEVSSTVFSEFSQYCDAYNAE